MEIILKQISLLNFKGVRNYETTFSLRTNVYGNNATFKTSLFDAFTWLLFGKNSLDQQQFEVKTLDKFNKVIPRLNHEVKALISIDGVDKEFKRILREKWVKKRGETEAEFTGNTEDFFIDRVPMTKSEYDKAISQIIKEDLFKLITNPLYFNSVMDWKERREMLFKMAGDVSYDEIAGRYEQLQEILPEIRKISIEGFKKQLYADRKAVREQLDQITPRIDEQTRTMPEYPNIERINNEIEQYQEQLKFIDNNLDAINKANEAKREALQEIYSKISELTELRIKLIHEANNKALEGNSAAKAEINTYKSNIEDRELEIESLQTKIASSQKEIAYLEEQNNVLRDKIRALNDDKPDFSKILEMCPTCKRPFTPDEIEGKKDEIEKAFNEEKVRKYNSIRNKGIANSQDIDRNRGNISTCKEKINALENEIRQFQDNIPEFIHEYKPEDFLDKEAVLKIDNEINSLREELDRPQPVNNDLKQLEERQEIQLKIDKLRDQLSVIRTINDKKKRIAELESEAKNLAGQLAAIEKREYLAEMFENAYVSGIEEKINSMFTNVQFRMFKEQINGGRTEDCTLIVNGVPWNDLNSGGKIQAGIECINVISEHFDCYAPVWIDNAETITQLPETKSQLIRLIVSKDYNQLIVEEE